MLKKILIAVAVIVGIVVLAVAALFIFSWTNRPKTDKEFLSQLKGEVVFTRSNSEGISDIWKINANGTDEKLLFHNDLNPFKTDSRNPLWSIDGEKIYFISFNQNKNEVVLEMGANGENVKSTGNTNYEPVSSAQSAQANGIKEARGDLLIITNGQEQLIYDAKYDGKFNTGVSYVSWSPDKKYLIFVDNRYTIYIADTNGNITKLTTGSAPNWKY